MNERIREWLTKNCTGQVENIHSNGLDYQFHTMNDGWIAVVDVTAGIWHTVIEAQNKSKALDYVCMIEPVTVPVNIL